MGTPQSLRQCDEQKNLHTPSYTNKHNHQLYGIVIGENQKTFTSKKKKKTGCANISTLFKYCLKHYFFESIFIPCYTVSFSLN